MDCHLDPIGDEPEQDACSLLETAYQMSNLLETNLTLEQLSIILELLSCGANAEELAKLILQLKKESNQKQNLINKLFKPPSGQ